MSAAIQSEQPRGSERGLLGALREESVITLCRLVGLTTALPVSAVSAHPPPGALTRRGYKTCAKSFCHIESVVVGAFKPPHATSVFVLNGLAENCVLKVCTVSPPKRGRMVPITDCFSNRYDFAKPLPIRKELLGERPLPAGSPRDHRPPDVAKARLNFLSSGLFEGQRRADQQFSLARLNRASSFVPFPSAPLGLPLLARSG